MKNQEAQTALDLATVRNYEPYCKYLALINRAGGLYGRILTEVVRTDLTAFGLYT